VLFNVAVATPSAHWGRRRDLAKAASLVGSLHPLMAAAPTH